MTNDYQDLQHLDGEDNGHQLRQGKGTSPSSSGSLPGQGARPVTPASHALHLLLQLEPVSGDGFIGVSDMVRPLVPRPPQPLFRRFCSGPCLLLLSLGLGLLLLVVVCVIGSQNSKLRGELQALRETFSNFTATTEVEVKALSSQGGNVGRKMKSLESQLEKQQQDLSEDHSGLLFHVKQFVSDLRSLSCQMAVLQGNGSARTCCPVNWLEYEGSCYWFSRSGKPWPDADRYCQLESAHLVVVNSREEQKFVQHHMGPVNTWMGLTDQSGLWKWVDGTDYETGFQNWRPEQPDDWYGHGLGGGEDCAHFTDDGRWNDDVCQRPYRWVCETPREPAS